MQGKRKTGSERKRELDVEQDGGREHERKMKGGRDGQEGVGGVVMRCPLQPSAFDRMEGGGGGGSWNCSGRRE